MGKDRSPPMVLVLPTLFVILGMVLVGAGVYYFTRSWMLSLLASVGVFMGELVMLMLSGLGYRLDRRRVRRK